MFLFLLLLLTILFAFTSGIALGYWVIFGILNLFDPARLQPKQATGTLATASGD